jgi:hypothetical protein
LNIQRFQQDLLDVQFKIRLPHEMGLDWWYKFCT